MKPVRLIRPVSATAFAVALAGAFTGTHLPPREIPVGIGSDKVAHAVGYFVLGTLLWIALRARALPRTRRIGWTLGGLAVYAAFDELTQPLFSRHASLADALADVAGVLSAVGACEAVTAILASRRR